MFLSILSLMHIDNLETVVADLIKSGDIDSFKAWNASRQSDTDSYTLQLLLWADNCEAITVGTSQLEYPTIICL